MADQFAAGILAGSQSVSVPVILRVKSDGAELTGKAAANMSAYYWRQGATGVQAITLATLGSVGAVFSAGGWYEVDATNLKGAYRMDLPNTAVSTGAEWVVIGVKDTAASSFYFYERFALETVHNSGLPAYADIKSAASQALGSFGAVVYADVKSAASQALGSFGAVVYADVKSAASSAWSNAAATNRVFPADGSITAAVLGADCITSAKVGAGALDYGDQILVFDASIKSAASAAWAAAAGTSRVVPAVGSITNAVFGTDVLTAAVFAADFLTSAKVAPGAFTYDDQITTFKSELSGMAIFIPNGHITSAKIGADAIGSDKIGAGAIVYGDQLTSFDADVKSAASAAIAAAGLSTLGVADIKSAASAAIAAYAPLTDKTEFRLSVVGVRDITQYTSAQGGVPGSSPSLYDAAVWNAAQSSFKRIQTPTTYLLHLANGTAFASAPVSGDSASVTIGVFTNV